MEKSLQKVYKSSLRFLVPLTLDETYKTIVSEAIKLVGGNEGSISTVKNGKIERSFATSNLLLKISPRRKGHTYSAYKQQKSIILTKRQLEHTHPELKKLRVVSDIIVPLVNRGQSIGVLTVLSSKKTFKKKDMSILQLFGPLASLSIRKAQLYNELESAIRTRDLFISMASHELRTPLTTAYTYLQLQNRRVEKGGKIQKEWIDITMRELMRLNNLVDGLLQLNQIKKGVFSYNLNEAMPQEIIQAAVSNFKAMHKSRKINFKDETSSKARILGDFERLTQVFVNILDNAAKHSQTDTLIAIKLSSSRRSIVVEIKDEGKGMSSSELRKAFAAFYKGENNTKAGMGLGLYLSKQIVEDHRGKINLNSDMNKGTKVVISLPKIKYESRD